MTSERWFVVKAEPCAWAEHGFDLCRSDDTDCNGCMGDGLRVRPDSAVEVEPGDLYDGDVFDNWPRGASVPCWVATERTEQ